MSDVIPAVSVIIPLYNKVNDVARTIRSVLNQTSNNFELIIINDGSTDGGENVISQFKDSRIRFFSQENCGPGATRNRGIKLARAEMIAFLDADDVWLPNFLETILDLYNKYPTAGLFATSYDFFTNKGIIHHNVTGLPKKDWEGILPSYFKTFNDSGFDVFITNCVVIPKQSFKKVGYFWSETNLGEDIYLFGKIALKTSIAYTTKSCVLYNINPGKRTSNTFTPTKEHPFSAYVRSLSEIEIKSYPYYSDLMLYVEFRDLEIAYVNIGAGAMNLARQNLAYISSKKYGLKKKVLSFISYLPFKLGKYVVIVRAYVSRKILQLSPTGDGSVEL